MRTESVKENTTFRRAYYKGKSVHFPIMSMYILRGKNGKTRLGITVSKKIGCSPKRNRIRRIIRAAFANCKNVLPEGKDIIIVARSAILPQKSTDVERCLREYFEKNS